MTDEVKEQEQGFPGWLKATLIVAAIVVALSVVLIAGCIMFVTNMRNPAQTRELLNSFASVEEPLPSGFQYQLGLNVMGNKIVVLTHAPDSLTLFFGSFTDRDLKDPQEIINKISSNGNGRSQFIVKQKGEETVGGRKMSYVIGDLVSSSGNTHGGGKAVPGGVSHPAMVGIFPPTADQKVTCLFGQAVSGDTYNLDETNELLKAIKKI